MEVFVRASQHHTCSIQTGHSPTWNEVFTMPVHSIEHQRVKYVLWDWDAVSPNDEIGSCQVDVTSLIEGEVKDVWLDVAGHGSVGDSSRDDACRHRDGPSGTTSTTAAAADKGSVKAKGVARFFMLSWFSTPMKSTMQKERKNKQTCRLHVRLLLRKWTEQEHAMIHRAKRVGIRRFLMETEEGRGMDQQLRALLAGGVLRVVVHRCSGLHMHRVFFRPSVSVIVVVELVVV